MHIKNLKRKGELRITAVGSVLEAERRKNIKKHEMSTVLFFLSFLVIFFRKLLNAYAQAMTGLTKHLTEKFNNR